MPSTTTKIFKNLTKEPINVIGVDEVLPGEQVSVSAEYHQPVVLENYPGLVEITADDYGPDSDAQALEAYQTAKAAKKAAESEPPAPEPTDQTPPDAGATQ